MANDVNNFITIECNEEARAEMKRIAEAINKSEHKNLEVADVLWDGEFENHISWTTENFGAKWCTCEEACEDHLMLTSAWYQVDGVQDKLYEKLKKFDENVIVKMITMGPFLFETAHVKLAICCYFLWNNCPVYYINMRKINLNVFSYPWSYWNY